MVDVAAEMQNYLDGFYGFAKIGDILIPQYVSSEIPTESETT